MVKIVVPVKGSDVTMTSSEARRLYEDLRNIFENPTPGILAAWTNAPPSPLTQKCGSERAVGSLLDAVRGPGWNDAN